MFSPVQKGIEKSASSVRYLEATPPISLSGFVHRYWSIKAEEELLDDFYFHVLPDACVHVVFSLGTTKGTGITALRTHAQELNLGKSFHYVGVRFLPGVWRGDPSEFVSGVIDAPYRGVLPLGEAEIALAGLDALDEQANILSKLVCRLVDESVVAIDDTTTEILARIGQFSSVADMAEIVGLSARQVQRKVTQATGFSPHDLLKVIRLQQSFDRHFLDLYSDQSHYIHNFRKMTGYTPEKYAKKFDV